MTISVPSPESRMRTTLALDDELVTKAQALLARLGGSEPDVKARRGAGPSPGDPG